MNPNAPIDPQFLDPEGNPLPRAILPENFKAKGSNFNQLFREGRAALYQLTNIASGRISFEVVIIQGHDGRIIQGTKVMPSEFYPSTSSWGSLGWTYTEAARSSADAKVVALCVRLGTRTAAPARRRTPLPEIANCANSSPE